MVQMNQHFTDWLHLNHQGPHFTALTMNSTTASTAQHPLLIWCFCYQSGDTVLFSQWL